MRRTVVCSIIAAALIAGVHALPASAQELRWAGWGVDEAVGSASEGTHAWASHGLYQRGRELGLSKTKASLMALALMSVWELYEIDFMDSEGISAQDMVANSAGVLVGVLDMGVNYSYATSTSPPRRDDKHWLNVPLVPKNSMSYAVEIDIGPFTAGYKYLGWEGNLIIGSTSMPLLPSDAGPGRSMGYVGRVWPNGWHAALGYDDRQGIVAGGGKRVMVPLMGFDITVVVDSDGPRFGASCFVPYDSLF